MVSLSGGPKAVNGGLHHAALGCHTSGIWWHHWETMLLKSKLWATATEGSLLEWSLSPKKWWGRVPHTFTPTLQSAPSTSVTGSVARGISSDCFVLLSFWVRGKFLVQHRQSWFEELDTTSEEEISGGYVEGQQNKCHEYVSLQMGPSRHFKSKATISLSFLRKSFK